MAINNEKERRFYEIESANNSWSLRELKRQFNSGLYEGLSEAVQIVFTLKGGVKAEIDRMDQGIEDELRFQ